MKEKMSAKKRTTIVLLLLLAVIMTVTALTTTIFAADGIEVIGEMAKDVDGGAGIAEAFESYKIQDTVKTKDSWVGDMQYTVYFDRGEDDSRTVVPGYNQTKIIVYTVNTGVERIGTHTNKSIIQSMIDRGYVVIVLDYLNPKNANSTALGTSGSQFVMDVQDGKYFDKTTDIGKVVFARSGDYHERYLVPSGYDILPDNVFWEIDKHSTEGTLDKIVENWNSDFKTALPNKIVKWVREDGTRKTTVSVDGVEAEWFSDAAGKVADANGQYTKVKYTVAETITDCVDPDGSPLEMNLYTTVTYPTSPKKEVPVIAKASSNGDLTKTQAGSYKPHFYSFIYDGYAVAAYDYLWVPMAQNPSFGYYDGSSGNTGDHMNYGLMMYNDKLVNTAAMRFLRYLSANGGDTYNFDLDSFGVLGISKGGWFKFLGEKVVQSPLVDGNYATLDEKEEAINAVISAFMSDRYYSTHYGETRYQVSAGAIEGDVYTGEYVIEAGAKQPWLTYPDGSEIISGAQAIYAANGNQEDDVTEGHVPIFEISCLFDTYNAAYGSTNNVINIARSLDVELIYLEAPLGHAFAYGPDLNYGIDTFEVMMDFFAYYVKGDAVSVLYTEPRSDEREVALTDKITIKFVGTVTAEEISKVTVSSLNGTVNGAWTSAYGGTEWTFDPDGLVGGTKYTVTVPKNLKGNNGVEMGVEYTTTFVTEFDKSQKLDGEGDYYTFTAPALTTGNAFSFRFNVENDAINTAELYAVNGKGDTTGALLGKVNVCGAGEYEIDVSDYVIANSGKEITLFLKQGREGEDQTVVNKALNAAIPGEISKNTSYVTFATGVSVGGRKAMQTVVTKPTVKGVSKYYLATTRAFNWSNVTYDTITKEDIGRTYTFSIDVYDTISRTIQIRLKGMTSSSADVIDYDRSFYNFNTKAGEWTTFEFSYTVYEPTYGEVSLNMVQDFGVYLSTDGNKQSPVYFSNLKVTENLTDIESGGAYIAEKNGGSYVPEASAVPFAVYNGNMLIGRYATLSDTLKAYVSGYTIKLNKNYTLTDEDTTAALSTFSVVNLDLGAYTIACENTTGALIWIKGVDKYSTTVNISGGRILLDRTALISYDGSTTAANGKNVNVNLQNTYVAFSKLAYTTEVISESESGAEMNVNVSLTNCTLDISEDDHALDGTVVLPVSKTNGFNISYTVIGGEIKLTATRWTVIADDVTVVDLKKNSSGEYVNIVTPNYVSWDIDGTYKIDGGYATFVRGENGDNGYVTYTLEIGKNSTPYGIIPEEYLDAEKYPCVVFDGKGNFKKAFTCFMGANKNDGTSALSYVKDLHASNTWDEELGIHTGTNAVILFRRDYTYISGEKYDNWAQITGECTIDLGGYTISQYTAGTSNRLVTFEAKAWTNNGKFDYFWPTTINFKNGTLMTYDKSFIGIKANESNSASSNGIANKTVTFNFDNVNFGLIEGATVSEMLVTYLSIDSGDKAYFTDPLPFNVNLNDCTFDVTNSAAETLTVINANPADGKWVKATVNVNGGKIVGGDMSGVTLCTSNSTYGSSLTFCVNENGEYIKVETTSSSFESTSAFPTDDGIKYLVKESESGSKTVYTLGNSASATKYGIIPDEYLTEEMIAKYPFVLFDGKGNFLGAYEQLLGTTSSSAKAAVVALKNLHAKENTWNSTLGAHDSNTKAVVLMRRDYTFVAGEKYDNWSQIVGEGTIDLGGYTLYQSKEIGSSDTVTRHLFDITSKAWTNSNKYPYHWPSTLNVINGSIKTYDKTFFRFQADESTAEAANSIADKLFTLNFDGVTFGLMEGSPLDEMMITCRSIPSGDKNYFTDPAPFVLNLSNCTFDISNRTTDTFTVLDADSESAKWLKITLNVSGCKIVSDDMSGVNVYSSNGVRGSSISFTKGNGEYIELYLAPGVAVPTAAVPTAEGDKYFVRTGSTEYDGSVYYVYTLTDKSFTEYAPKMSITLHSQLIVNAYIPVESTEKFTFNGAVYENLSAIADKIVTLDDGKSYYQFSVALASASAAENVKLTAIVTSGGKTATANYTFSIPKYAAKLIANGNDVEKALGYDVLAYIKAAYEYFDSFNTEEEIERVTALIDSVIGDYKSVPTSSGVINTVSPVSSVTLNLGEKPTIRFYVTDTNVTFFANERKLNTVKGTDATYGAYVELDVYAFALAETITYADGGSYHISDFVNGAKGTAHEALVNAFVKYVESAAAYRNSVINK